MLFFLALALTCCPLESLAEQAKGEVLLPAAKIHASPASARLLAVPVLEPGKPAWVSVWDQCGKPLSGVSVLVNGLASQTDDFGQANFQTPQADAVKLCLLSADGKEIAQSNYVVTPGGLLVSQRQAAKFFDGLSLLISRRQQAPAISYAPALLEARQPFVIVGKNFGGKSDADRLVLDDFDCDIFSGSTVAILATAPKRLPLGPLRELYIVSGAESSNAVEVDICRVEAELRSTDDPLQKKGSARVRVVGTNFPALVEVENLTPGFANLLFSERVLGESATFIAPGGEQNVVPLDFERRTKGDVTLEAHLVADAPCCPEDHSALENPELRKLLSGLNLGQIIRLKRRLLALASRVSDQQEKRRLLGESPLPSSSELESCNCALKSLCLRQGRLTSMLNARRVLLESLEGSDEDFRQALDAAAGSVELSLEDCLRQGDPLAKSSRLALSQGQNMKTQCASTVTAGTERAKENVLTPHRDKKDMVATIASFTRIWQKFPTRPPHQARLAPPPAPYVPDSSQIGPWEDTYQAPDLLQVTGGERLLRKKKSGRAERRSKSARNGQRHGHSSQ